MITKSKADNWDGRKFKLVGAVPLVIAEGKRYDDVQEDLGVSDPSIKQ